MILFQSFKIDGSWIARRRNLLLPVLTPDCWRVFLNVWIAGGGSDLAIFRLSHLLSNYSRDILLNKALLKKAGMEHGEGEHSCFPKKKGFKFQPLLSTNTYCTTSVKRMYVCLWVYVSLIGRMNGTLICRKHLKHIVKKCSGIKLTDILPWMHPLIHTSENIATFCLCEIQNVVNKTIILINYVREWTLNHLIFRF